MTSSKSGAARTRDELAAEMTRAFREYQRSVDALDELASRLIGVNRTDARVLDLLEQHGRLSAGDIAAGGAPAPGAGTGGGERPHPGGGARRRAPEGGPRPGPRRAARQRS